VRSGSKAGEPSLPHCNLVRPDHHTSQSQIVGGQAQIQWEDRVDLWNQRVWVVEQDSWS
jgi:hypothetical protein